MDTFSILVFKAGNKSLDFSLLVSGVGAHLKSTIKGNISNIGGMSLFTWSYKNINTRLFIDVRNHQDAAELALDWLQNLWPFGSLLDDVGLVEHQFNDDKKFYTPIIMTEKLTSQLQGITPYITPHNANMINVLLTSQKMLSQEILAGKMLTIATFDNTIINNLLKPEHLPYQSIR